MAKLTIDQIAVANLGPFRERQVIDLEVKASKPVILIKALNGSGKTTLLTALQIGLYGYRAINAARRSEYDQLIASLQRNDATGNSAIDLTVSLELGTYRQTLLIHREWVKRGATLQEQFEVTSNGSRDVEYTALWDEFINHTLLPVELVQLFFFDGEKIESLANPERLPQLLRRATEVFLGLSGVDALANDLKALERRNATRHKVTSSAHEKANADVATYAAQLEEANRRIEILIQRQGEAHAVLDKAQRALEAFSVEAQRQGLNAYEQAASLREREKILEEQRKQAQGKLVQALEDPLLPLAWLGPLWDQFKAQWQQDQEVRRAQVMVGEFIQRDQRILQMLAETVPDVQQQIAVLLEQDLAQLKLARQHKILLVDGPDPAGIEQHVAQARSALQHAAGEIERAKQALEAAQRDVAQIPAEEQLSRIFEQMQAHTKAVSDADMQLNQLTAELNEARITRTHFDTRWQSAVQRVRAEFKDSALELKALEAADRAKKALVVFRERLLASKAQWLAEMITAEFKQVLRKRNLISKVTVDPVSYAVAIEDAKGHTLPMERLSAGERQILAIAVLSALIRERKGRFPVVVDTPLARLDRKHREALINNFFAKISHQVLVLSTDEEVEGPVYQALHRHMNREYELAFDDATRSSTATLHQFHALAEAIQ